MLEEKKRHYNLPQSLKKLRISRGLSQAKMAELMGVSQRSYSGYENGERSVPSDAIIKLAFRAKVDVIQIFTGGRTADVPAPADRPAINIAIAKKTVELLRTVGNACPDMSADKQESLVIELITDLDFSRQL